MANCTKCGFPIDKHPEIGGQMHCINGKTPPDIDFGQLAFTIKYKDKAGAEFQYVLTSDCMKMCKRVHDLIREGAKKVVVTWTD